MRAAALVALAFVLAACHDHADVAHWDTYCAERRGIPGKTRHCVRYDSVWVVPSAWVRDSARAALLPPQEQR